MENLSDERILVEATRIGADIYADRFEQLIERGVAEAYADRVAAELCGQAFHLYVAQAMKARVPIIQGPVVQ